MGRLRAGRSRRNKTRARWLTSIAPVALLASIVLIVHEPFGAFIDQGLRR